MRVLWGVTLSVFILLVVAAPRWAVAATIYANSSTGNDSTGDGSSGAPYATFHKAYTSASSGDIIDLTGTFTWTDAAETGDSATTGYTIGKNLTIQGQGSDATYVQVASASTTGDRRVTISSGVEVTMSKLNIRNGRITSTSYYGGGISNSGTLYISDSEVNSNTAGGGGGGIDNLGTTTIERVAIYNNTVTYMGGGVVNNYNISANGYLVIENSTIYNNRQTSTSGYLNGGGVHVRNGNAYLTNNTITSNWAKGGGGLGMDTTGSVYIMNNIIAGNTSATYGSIYNDIYKSSGTLVDNGYNIIGQPGGVTMTTGDWSDTDRDGTFTLYSVGTTGSLNLDTGVSANDNATKTPTYAILSSSIAINNGTTGSNGDNSTAPSLDARGAGRSGSTDIGAFEYNGTGLTVIEPTTAASGITFSDVQYKQMTISWTSGSGARRAVFMKAASSGTASPVDGSTYTASSVFGSGDQIGSSGWYAIYDDVGSFLTVTGLSAGTDYIVQVFEYNGVNTGASDYDAGSGSGNPASQASYAPVTIYSNATSGNDTTGDGSSGTPYKTFYKAYSVSNPGDTIDLTGTFTWTDSDETGDAATTGFTIGKDLIITGNNPDVTIVQSASASTSADRRVFTVSSGVTVTIKKLTIQNGRTTGSSQYGGGIANSGTLTLQHANVTNNIGGASGGGGVSNYGTATIENSAIFNNTGYYMGAGIVNIATGAVLTVTNTTIFGNYQQSSVAYTEGGGMTIRYGTVTITNSTIAYNSSYSAGGGIYLDDPTGVLYLENTIIAKNTQRSGSTGSDFGKYTSATMNDNGGNIVGRSSGYTFSASGDWTDTDNNDTWTGAGGGSGTLYLDTALSYNSNSYKTYTLAITDASSIAVDNASTSANNGVSVPTTDQRAFSRSGSADIGAYEYGGTNTSDVTAPTVSLTAPTDGASIAGGSVTISADASDDSAVSGVSFYIAGALQGSEDTSSPYGITWDSTGTTSGSKIIYAVARDAGGNYATSSFVSVTLANQPTPASVAVTPDTSSASISWTTPYAGSSRVFFGISSYLSSSTAEENTSSRVTSHSASLAGLPSCAVFSYVVVSVNAGSDISTSTESTFITSGCTGSASITSHSEDDITTSSGGSLSEGNLSLTVPASFTATSSSASFQISQIDQSAFSSTAGAPSGVSLIGTDVFHLAAYSDATTTLSSFLAALTVTMTYSASDASSYDTSSFKIHRYDGSTWTELSNCTVDTSARTVSCETTEFSDFAIFGEEAPASSGSSTGNGPLPGTIVVSLPKPRPQIIYPDGNIVYLDSPNEHKENVSEGDSVKAQIPSPADEDGSQFIFKRTLRSGSEGVDVKDLQKYLNSKGFLLSSRGVGSPGNETEFFGPLTWNALVKFQETHSSYILEPWGLTRGSGIFGTKTREFVESNP